MKKIILILAATLIIGAPAKAEVFKCIVHGKSTYQSSPCPSESSGQSIKIKSATDSQKEAAIKFQDKLATENKNKAIQKQKQADAAKDAQIKADRQIIRREEEAAIRQYFDKDYANYLLRKR